MQEDQWALGRRIEEARTVQRLSKRAAAKAAGISETRWRHLESGVERIRGEDFPVQTTPDTIARVASALRMNQAELLVEAGFAPDAVPEVPADLGHEAIDVSGLSSEDVDKVRSYIAFLREESKTA
ncbi:helix-turn-helix domain-containing protein [Nocardia bovistercoris]|uniref:Helix-turn-helix transcriptional regulator n=1 Tax=Nocardia bovistercoris TaxID=2785916 RepID=A0A931IE02_9NOCA|nr:helix-turn-helix transcriptional regulator [Nocardia bovistercoris]MBH0778771.1 helix-turn-helix transcriptional regulator [Nocardia bovistercoris]